MSWTPCPTPETEAKENNDVEMVIVPRTGDIGNFEVHRALPFKDRRMVGPFIFWDQMGPGEFLTGQGVDVRPHPHIGLSTLTYLFDGSLDHKDSLGNDTRIMPGDMNLMTAGAGIVHSERTGQDIRKTPSRLFGIQSWIAQPKRFETAEASFKHYAESDLPNFDDTGISGRLLLGKLHGITSPVEAQWDTLYAEVRINKGHKFDIPKDIEERAIYILHGTVSISGKDYPEQEMIVLQSGKDITVTAVSDVHMMVLGGAAMDGPRYIYWNFVASDRDMIDQAKRDWKDGKFAKVPGDEKEFIPLPDK